MKINLTLILGILVLVMGGIIFWQYKELNKPQERVKIPYHIPAQRGAILQPKASIKNIKYIFVPIKSPAAIDTALLEKYRAENDSLKKELMYRDAITIREYEETYSDTLLNVTAKVRVRGTLLDMYIPSYTIHPIEGEVPYTPPLDWGLFAGGELGIPTTYDTPFLIKVNLDFQYKKMMYGGSYDSERRVWGRLSYKLL